MADTILWICALILLMNCCAPLRLTATPPSAEERRGGLRTGDLDCFESEPSAYTCGDGFCSCSDEKRFAVCLGLVGAFEPIQYVPNLPSSIWYLCFVHQNLTSIEGGSFFRNVTQISWLHLGFNGLVSLHPSAFALLKNLTHLSLEGNSQISAAALSVVLSTVSLRHLDLSNCDIGRVSPGVFRNITLPRLRFLSLKENEIENLNMSLFSSLSQLRHVEMQTNRLIHTHVRSVLYFQYLDLSSNNLYDFPRTCGETNQSFFPNLRHLSLDGNFISTLPSDICLPRLNKLLLSDNNIRMLHSGILDGLKFPFLTLVDFSEMQDDLFVGDGAFVNMTSLKAVGLESNDMRITIDDIFRYFVNCPRVSDLVLDENNIVIETTAVNPGRTDLTSMKSLRIASCGISKILPDTFCAFGHLTHLDLSENLIYHLPDGSFDCLRHLTDVDLSYNKILVVSPATFSAHLQSHLVHLDLSFNLFQCNCDLLWFQAWMRRAPQSLFHRYKYSYYDYNCKNNPDTTIPEFVLSEQACLLRHEVYVNIVTVVIMVIIMLTVVVVVFRYHWHLRLLCYEACRGTSQVRRMRLEQGQFDYDVFVCYDSEDLPWVRQHLMPQLEGRLGLRLCVHERDFPAGYIVDSIVRCVESSKKVLMLFSQHFVKSRWCQFELSFCLRHVMEYEDALMVVCLDEVTSRDLTSGMMAVLKTTTYVQWVDGDEENNAFFWRRLGVALQEIMPGPQVV